MKQPSLPSIYLTASLLPQLALGKLGTSFNTAVHPFKRNATSPTRHPLLSQRNNADLTTCQNENFANWEANSAVCAAETDYIVAEECIQESNCEFKFGDLQCGNLWAPDSLGECDWYFEAFYLWSFCGYAGDQLPNFPPVAGLPDYCTCQYTDVAECMLPETSDPNTLQGTDYDCCLLSEIVGCIDHICPHVQAVDSDWMSNMQDDIMGIGNGCGSAPATAWSSACVTSVGGFASTAAYGNPESLAAASSASPSNTVRAVATTSSKKSSSKSSSSVKKTSSTVKTSSSSKRTTSTTKKTTTTTTKKTTTTTKKTTSTVKTSSSTKKSSSTSKPSSSNKSTSAKTTSSVKA